MSNSNNSPIDRIRVGRVAAAIWRNTGDDGKHFYSFTLDRSYEDKNGKWQSTDSFGLNDALVAAKVCNLADTRIRKLYDADRQAENAEQTYDDDVAA